MWDFLSIVFCIAGFVGYCCDIYWLLIASFVFYILETLIGMLSLQQKSLKTTLLAVIIGSIIAKYNHLDMFETIIVALNYESVIITIFSIIYLCRFRAQIKKMYEHDDLFKDL